MGDQGYHSRSLCRPLCTHSTTITFSATIERFKSKRVSANRRMFHQTSFYQGQLRQCSQYFFANIVHVECLQRWKRSFETKQFDNRLLSSDPHNKVAPPRLQKMKEKMEIIRRKYNRQSIKQNKNEMSHLNQISVVTVKAGVLRRLHDLLYASWKARTAQNSADNLSHVPSLR